MAKKKAPPPWARKGKEDDEEKGKPKPKGKGKKGCK